MASDLNNEFEIQCMISETTPDGKFIIPNLLFKAWLLNDEPEFTTKLFNYETNEIPGFGI